MWNSVMEQWPCFSVFCIFIRFLNVDQQKKTRNVSEGSQKLSITRGRNSTLSRMWQKMDLPLHCCRTSDDWYLRNCFVSTIESLSRIPSTMLMSAAQKNLSKRIYRAAMDYTIIDRFRSAVAWCECCIRKTLSHSKWCENWGLHRAA